jgi:N-acetylneuraminate synthase
MFDLNFKEVHIIAEIGINHNGSLEHAKELIKAAKEAGANSVKVQVRNLEEIYTKSVLNDPLKAEHGTQYLLHELQKAHLTYDDVKELQDYAKEINVTFFATPFDNKSADFLNELGCEIFKIGSPDFTNLPLITKVCSFNKPIILSTGMSTEEEIRTVVSYLKENRANFALLHCNSTYPASFQDINLNYIPELKRISGTTVGYSGHERGFAPTLAAISQGAMIIERHITKNIDSDGPDHSSSLSIDEFHQMTKAVRQVEQSLGVMKKIYNQGEQNNRLSLAKSLVFSKDFPKGHTLQVSDLISKTPAKGLSPLELGNFIGKTLNEDVLEDSYIFYHQLSENKKEATKTSFDIPKTWGIVGRLNDFRDFLDLKPDLVEIHLTWRDLVDFKPEKFNLTGDKFSQDLVVHAPEYYHDELIDFTSSDSNIVEMSLDMLQKTFNLAKDLSPSFTGVNQNIGPRVVVHPGGHFKELPKNVPKDLQYSSLEKNLSSLNSEGLRVLVENMPPFPWYFGGQWYNTVFLDPGEISQFANNMGWGVCYDLSHAQLYCNSANITLKEFTKKIKGHIHYLHISDGMGTTQEGLQLGHGDMDFDHLFEILNELDVGFIPEIWQGHLNNGQGFKEALVKIEDLLKNKMSGKSCFLNHVHDENCGG